MLSVGNGFYVQLSGPKGPGVLHPASVLAEFDDGFEGALEEGDVRLTRDQQLVLFCEIDSVFMKQAARVVAFVKDGDKPTFRFLTQGEPTSAERRQLFRVSTVISDMTVGLGGESSCPLLDVSATGFSALARPGRTYGETITASLSFKKSIHTGNVLVQSVRDLGGGRMRYGLSCADDRGKKSDLRRILQQVTMSVQRAHLKRMAGVA